MRETPIGLLLDARAARKQGSAGVLQRQRERLAEMVTYARTSSPYYRRLYQGLPARVTDPSLSPPEMAEYIGEKPEPVRLAQLTAHREAAARPPQPPWQPTSWKPKARRWSCS